MLLAFHTRPGIDALNRLSLVKACFTELQAFSRQRASPANHAHHRLGGVFSEHCTVGVCAGIRSSRVQETMAPNQLR